MQTHLWALAAAACLATAPTHADIRVRFIEGAPKDQFVVTNEGRCAVPPSELVVDLSGSKAGLVFDVTGSGAGVEVFQPFEMVEGAGALTSMPSVSDGDTQVSLSLGSLAPRARIAFTIDVDDTLGARGITVSGSEIAGATVRWSAAGVTHSGAFSSAGAATVATAPCT